MLAYSQNSKKRIYIKKIKKLVSLQDDLYIESKDQIEIYQDKRNNDLHIEDPSYLKKPKTLEYDGPEMY